MIPALILLALAILLLAHSTGESSVLSIKEIASFAENAGFSGDDLTIAVSVALAESGGNPRAYNPEKAAGAPEGEGSYGLWQIYLHAHPEYKGKDLYDPQVNARAAYQIYSDAAYMFTPWSTFKSGAYLAKMDNVSAEITA